TEELIEKYATKLESHDLAYLENKIKQAVNKKHVIDADAVKSLYSWDNIVLKMQKVINLLVKPE
ncbi:MAG: hypothetical protein ABIB98_04085, partial [bacterium]